MDAFSMQQSLHFFDKLTDAEKRTFLNKITKAHYKKGETIYSADNECVGMMVIQSGELRTYMLSEEGREITLYRLQAGDVCVLSASCVLKNITFDVTIDAEKDSDVWIINAPFFQQLYEGNVYVQNFSLKIAVDRFSDVMWAMEQILFMSFDKRLAVFLLDEYNKSESETLFLTHEQIAKYTGSAREVVSRMVKYFCAEGILKSARGSIQLLDKERLKKIAN